VSTQGGSRPRWARNGELFYKQGSKLMVVSIEARFSVGSPRELFEPPFPNWGENWDVSADGQHFVIAKPVDANASRLVVVPDCLTSWMLACVAQRSDLKSARLAIVFGAKAVATSAPL
jgi:hypothetical protein